MKSRILVVDDDKDLLALLEKKLGEEGYLVQLESDGLAAIQKIRKKEPDLIILDINMPKVSGMEVCRVLRSEDRTKKIPIIMLTARDEEVDRILGLEFGADDYVTKPFNPRELVLRIKNILKRVQDKSDKKQFLQHGPFWMDVSSHEVKVRNKPVQLTLTEFKLLFRLLENPGKVQTRDSLLDEIWEYGENVFSRTIDTHVQRLRAKLREGGKYIKTVRGVGYQIQEP